MADGSRLIRDERDRNASVERDRILSEIRALGRFERPRVDGRMDNIIEPHYPPPEGYGPGDPAGPGGQLVTLEELSEDVQQLILGASDYQMLEVILTFPDAVAAGVAINIQTGVYGGGGPATVKGDTVTLPGSQDFEDDGRISVLLNGQELERGRMVGVGEVYWASATQVALNAPLEIFSGNKLILRAPVVPPAPAAV